MKKSRFILKILLFSLLINTASPLFADDTSAEPYNTDEFPQALKDLRRFEIVSLGSMPFVTLNTSLVYSGIRYGVHGFDSAYAPNPFASSSYTSEEQKEILLTSLAISVGIGLADYIIQVVKRNKQKRQQELSREDLYIMPLSEDSDATLIDFSDAEESNYQETLSDNYDVEETPEVEE